MNHSLGMENNASRPDSFFLTHGFDEVICCSHLL